MAMKKVSEIMTRAVVSLAPNDSVHEAARLLATNGITGAPVLEAGGLVGIVSEADIVDSMWGGALVAGSSSWRGALSLMKNPLYPHQAGQLRVLDIMTTHVVTTEPESSIWAAATTMYLRGVNRLPVMDEGTLVGIVTRADLVAAMARDDATVRDDVLRSLAVLGDEVFSDLEVNVDDGVATLSGSADRRSTHDIAIRMASWIPGVIEVRDDLSYLFDDSHLKLPISSDEMDPRHNWNEMQGA